MDPASIAPRQPCVSVIVAVYNEERHVGRCLESLLAQTYRPLEIVVADDGSTDRTADVVRGFGAARLLRLAHAGKARAVNAAAREAAGEVLVFADGDLWFAPDYVARLVEPILAGGAAGASHADERVANPDNVWSRCLQVVSGLPRDRRLALSPEQLAAGTVVFRAVRRDAFLRAGGFDDTGYLDDQSLAPKLGARAAFVPGAVCYHYNAETLREVFAMGVWGGKSVHYRHGPRALVRYAPPVALAAALGAAWRHAMPALAIHVAVHRTGMFWGVLKRTLGLDRTLGA